jgi:hypothetical protein
MNRVAVTSSALASVGYDIDTLTLEVELSSGQVYQYFGVTEAVYLELMSSASKGQYYNQQIRNAYQYAHL